MSEYEARVQRPRRLWAEVIPDKFFAAFDQAVKQDGYAFLCTITGLDEGPDYGLIYHLSRADGTVLSLKTRIAKDQAMKTVTAYFPSAAIYERELTDLLGVKIAGLPEGRRYPLSDDWPEDQHPLLKDWKPQFPEEKKNA